ncbi:MAG: glycosyltransferase, partial [Pyramidobacter sp.]|nr:glycosyltransferase [Pyramidobacter sp.]
ETDIFTAHGERPLKILLEGSPLGVRGVRSLKRWKQLASSYFECRAALERERADCCVLFGGYLSMPVLLAARRLGIPVLMHEQNTVAGKVTRFASRRGVPVACAWKECRLLDKEKINVTGLPLRPLPLIDKNEAQTRLIGAPLEGRQKLVVILGGSLGSGGMKNMLQSSQDMIKSTG